jgi:hypothetical protein
MSTFNDSQMRELEWNKQPNPPHSLQHRLREPDQRFYHSGSASQPEFAARHDSCSSMPTVALLNLLITSTKKFEDLSGLPKPSPEDKGGLYNKKHHRNKSLVDTNDHDYICRTQKLNKVPNDHLSVNTDPKNGSVIRWTPGSHLLYFVSRENLAKGDGKLEKIRESMDVATQSWQSTGINLAFQETRVRKEATFVVFYDPTLDTETYAIAFFPHADDRYIRIGHRTFRSQYIKHMARVLGHELGHVLGLRHEYWRNLGESDNVHHFPTEDHDNHSIMNNMNVHDLSLLVLSPLDCANIKELYDLPAGSQTGFTIANCDPVPLQRYRISFSSKVGSSMRRRSF